MCKFGDKCRNAHGESELVSRGPKSEERRARQFFSASQSRIAFTWSPFSKSIVCRPDGSIVARPHQWGVGVLELPRCSEITISCQVLNGGSNLISMVPPKDDFYSEGAQWMCGQTHRASEWGPVLKTQTSMFIHSFVTIVLTRRADTETTCAVTCASGGKDETTVLRGFPPDYLIAFGLCHGNTVEEISIDSGWLRRRGYLMVLLLSLEGRATGGTDGTAVLLARLAHLPWDIVEHVFQWL